MTRAPLTIAIDVGTTGARAVAIDLDGRPVAQSRHSYRTASVRPGWAEQNPADWSDGAIAALTVVVQKLGAGRRDVVAIGLTGQCPTVAAFDRDLRPLTAGMLYRDNRAELEAEQMRDTVGEIAMHRRTGHVASAFHVGPKILWLRTHDPVAFAAAATFMQPRDVVLHRLTGRLATDETHANASLFYDLRERRFATDLLATFAIDEGLFPEVLAPWEQAESLPRATARLTGLRQGIPVVIGAADSQCVAHGAGVVAPGAVSEMAGASSCLNSAVPEPLEDLRVTHYSHTVPGMYCTEVGVNTTGAAVDWAVTRLGYRGHRALIADAERGRRRALRQRTGADVRAVAPLFMPYLADGDRDDPTLIAAFVGLSLRHDRAALAYAIVEGIALSVSDSVGVLVEAGSPLTDLRVAGGGARLGPAGQIKADLLGAPVLHLKADTAAIGTAMLAAAVAGHRDRAEATTGSVVAAAARFEPTRRGAEVMAERRAWFEQVRASDTIRREAS